MDAHAGRTTENAAFAGRRRPRTRANGLRGLLLLGALDQRGRHDQRAAARDDETVAGELVERAGNRLAAAADHVGQLLLRRTAANDETIGARRAFLAAKRHEAMNQPLVDVAQ